MAFNSETGEKASLKYWESNRRPFFERFWEKVNKTDSCWLWTGATNKGYGRIETGSHPRVNESAHRIAYKILVGEIPEDLVIDHLCRNRRCVNPAHLELVSLAENIRRGFCPAGKNHKLTHCSKGHPFTPENTSIVSRRDRSIGIQRRCKICRRAYMKAFYQKRAHARS